MNLYARDLLAFKINRFLRNKMTDASQDYDPENTKN